MKIISFLILSMMLGCVSNQYGEGNCFKIKEKDFVITSYRDDSFIAGRSTGSSIIINLIKKEAKFSKVHLENKSIFGPVYSFEFNDILPIECDEDLNKIYDNYLESNDNMEF